MDPSYPSTTKRKKKGLKYLAGFRGKANGTIKGVGSQGTNDIPEAEDLDSQSLQVRIYFKQRGLHRYLEALP